MTVVKPPAILRVSVALGLCAAIFDLTLWGRPIMAMANGHELAFKVSYVIWFLIGWGVGTGALTGLAVTSMRRRSPGPLAATLAFVAALILTSGVCLVLHRSFTDAIFMDQALTGLDPQQFASIYSPRAMHMDNATAEAGGFSRVAALVPSSIAVLLSVLYAFGGKLQGRMCP